MNKCFRLLCAFTLCFLQFIPLSYSENNSYGKERLDEGVIHSRGVGLHSPEATSLLSDFKEQKAEQINDLRNHVNVYVPPVSSITLPAQNPAAEKQEIELKKLQDDINASLKDTLPENKENEGNIRNLKPVVVSLPESLPEEALHSKRINIDRMNPKAAKVEGLISSSVVNPDMDKNDKSDDFGSIVSIQKKIANIETDEAHVIPHHSTGNKNPENSRHEDFETYIPQSLSLEGLILNPQDLPSFEEFTQNKKEDESVSEEIESLESKLETEKPFFDSVIKTVSEEALSQPEETVTEEYEIPAPPDFSEGVGAFLRHVSEEGFFHGSAMNLFISSEDEESFESAQNATAQCLENPADAICQDLFTAFMNLSLLPEPGLSDDPGIDLDLLNLTDSDIEFQMMQASLTPEDINSTSVFLLPSEGSPNEPNAENPQQDVSSSKGSKDTNGSNSDKSQDSKKSKIEYPLGLPDFYLPWKRAALHDAKFVKIESPAMQKTEPETYSKVQARIAPESTLQSVMPKFHTNDAQNPVQESAENNPWDMDFHFPLKSVFKQHLPLSFPIKNLAEPKRIEVMPVSSFQMQEIPMEWQVYEWFFEFCTDYYFYDWNWMLWLMQEESRFLRKLD